MQEKALTRKRLLSEPSSSLASPLAVFRKPVFRQIKMPLTEIEIQNLVEKRVPLFYGQHDVDSSEVNYFLDSCKRVSSREEFKNPAQAKILLEELVLRLRGRAYEMFRDSHMSDVKEFLTSFGKKFLPSYTIESLNSRLYSARQTRTEDCSEFGRRIRTYALDYEAGVIAKYGEENSLPKPLLDTLEREAFVKGLINETIKTHLTMLTGKSTKELVELASRLEVQLGYTPAKTINLVKCQLCDKTGHNAKECSTNIHNQKLNVSFCRYCGKSGHNLADCRTRRSDEARSQGFLAQTRIQKLQRPPQSSQLGYSKFPSHGSQPYSNFRNQKNPNPNNNYQPQQQLPNNNYPTQRPNQPKPSTNSPRKANYPQRGNARQQSDMDQIGNRFGNLSINYIEDGEIEAPDAQGNEQGLAELRP